MKYFACAGAYDTDGMLKSKSKGNATRVIRFLKFIGDSDCFKPCLLFAHQIHCLWRFFIVLGILDLDLHEAVLSGSPNHVKRAIKKIMKTNKNNIDFAISLINQYNETGRTALCLAVITNNVKIVDILIDKKALTGQLVSNILINNSIEFLI